MEISKKQICGITGSTGILGLHIIKSYKNIKFLKFKGNLLQKKQVFDWIKDNKFDLLIHLGAVVPIKKVEKNYKKSKKVNFFGTKYLVNALIKYQPNIKWFFFASTSHVYAFSKNKIKETNIPNPISKYGRTKLFAENYIKKRLNKTSIKYCIGRIFSFYSKKQSSYFLIKSLNRKINLSKKKTIKLNNLNHFRDFISVEKISEIIFFLYKKNFEGIINIASGKKIELKDIALDLNQKRKKIIFLDNIKTSTLYANISKLRRLGFEKKKLQPRFNIKL